MGSFTSLSEQCRRWMGSNGLRSARDAWRGEDLRGYGCGVVDGPAFGGGAGEEVGGGVYGEGAVDAVEAAGDGEHGGVVDGVAEDGVGRGDVCCDAYMAEGFYFVFVGGDVEEVVGDEAVGGDLYAGGEDVAGRDVEAANAFFDDPVVGGADGPDVAAVALEFGDELGHLGEDVGLDVATEEVCSGVAESFDGEIAVDLDHLAADVVFGDGAAFVAFVTVIHPGDLFGGDEFGIDGPVHEGGAGVAGPESAVAVEYSDAGGEGVDAGVEFRRGKRCGFGRDDGGVVGQVQLRTRWQTLK
jgi:hypothetical protein